MKGNKKLAAAISNAQPQALRDAMTALVMWVYAKLPEHRSDANDPPYDHHALYHAAATEFNLYDDQSRAPVWLSRMIEGIMHDAKEHGEQYRSI